MMVRCFLFLTLGLASFAPSVQDDRGQSLEKTTLCVETNVSAYTFSEDGSLLQRAGHLAEHVHWSPNRQFKMTCKQAHGPFFHVIVSDAEGKRTLQLTKEWTATGPTAMLPIWSPISETLVFLSRRSGTMQLHALKLADFTVEQLTHARHGVCMGRFLPNGDLLFLAEGPGTGKKLRLQDLILRSGQKETTLFHQKTIFEFAPSPDGRRLALSTLDHLGAVELYDMETRQSRLLKPPKAWTSRLQNHAARLIAWRPDGQALVCTFPFLGGRAISGKAASPKDGYVDGDWEVFWLALDGQSKVLEFKEEEPKSLYWRAGR